MASSVGSLPPFTFRLGMMEKRKALPAPAADGQFHEQEGGATHLLMTMPSFDYCRGGISFDYDHLLSIVVVYLVQCWIRYSI